MNDRQDDNLSGNIDGGKKAADPNLSAPNTMDFFDDLTANLSRKRRKELERQQIGAIRTQNEEEKRQAFEKKQNRKATLLMLYGKEKRAFLLKEKEEKRAAQREAAADKKWAQEEFDALSPSEKKQYRKNLKKQKKLRNKAKKTYPLKQGVKIILLAALAAGLFYAGNVAYGAFIDNSYAFHDTAVALSTPSPTAPPTPTSASSSANTTTPVTATPTPDPYELLLSEADLDFMEDRVNILVLGIDESLERANWGSFRTDTMILMSIDFETNQVCMITLPRDSYVWIYNRDYRTKINSAFSSGGGYNGSGFEYAMNTVSMALGGVPVNHYVCFDMNVVKEVVNAIGGLNYDVDITVNMCGRHIDPGYQYMDGQMVLDYCRQRKGSSDIARGERQQRMIIAIFNALKDTGQIQDIPAIYSAITGNIYTDLDFTQIVSLAAFAMKINLDDITRYMLPGDFLNIDGTSFWGVDQYEKRDLVKSIFGVDIQISSDDDVATLQQLAAEKRNAVAEANAAISAADSYVSANAAYISASEMADYTARKTALTNVAAVKDTKDVGPTISPITSATSDFNTWFAALQAAVEQRKAEAAALETTSASSEPSSP